jgi:hypothetical protein
VCQHPCLRLPTRCLVMGTHQHQWMLLHICPVMASHVLQRHLPHPTWPQHYVPSALTISCWSGRWTWLQRWSATLGKRGVICDAPRPFGVGCIHMKNPQMVIGLWRQSLRDLGIEIEAARALCASIMEVLNGLDRPIVELTCNHFQA